MTILTIGASPYLITRNGKINSDILMSLSDAGHQVESVVWHHDFSYFLPTETGDHRFDGPNGPVCQLHPFTGLDGELGSFVFEVIKKVLPQVVITIGTAAETNMIWAIKSLYPSMFKWIAIITMGSSVNEHKREAFQYADKIFATTRNACESIKRHWGLEPEFLPYGTDHNVFKPLNSCPDEFSVICCGKNAQVSNLPAFMASIGNIKATLHTNMHDDGENDLLLLKRRLQVDNLALPKRYISVRDGLSDEEMNELYNHHHVIVDTSMQSVTAVSMLDAMATGCVPVGMDFGAAGEVIKQMPPRFQHFVPFEIFVGPRQEEYAVISTKELACTLKNIKEQYMNDRDSFMESRDFAINVAQLFSKEIFAQRVNGCVETIVLQEHSIAVDSY